MKKNLQIIIMLLLFSNIAIAQSPTPWYLTGNTPLGTDFLGSTSAADLIFKTNATEAARIMGISAPNQYYFGINTVTPIARLHVEENLSSSITDSTITGYFHNGDPTTDGLQYFRKTALHAKADATYNANPTPPLASDLVGMNVGGDFAALNCDQWDVAVRGIAGKDAATIGSHVIGSQFEAYDATSNSIGASALVYGNSPSTQGMAAGVYTTSHEADGFSTFIENIGSNSITGPNGLLKAFHAILAIPVDGDATGVQIEAWPYSYLTVSGTFRGTDIEMETYSKVSNAIGTDIEMQPSSTVTGTAIGTNFNMWPGSTVSGNATGSLINMQTGSTLSAGATGTDIEIQGNVTGSTKGENIDINGTTNTTDATGSNIVMTGTQDNTEIGEKVSLSGSCTATTNTAAIGLDLEIQPTSLSGTSGTYGIHGNVYGTGSEIDVYGSQLSATNAAGSTYGSWASASGGNYAYGLRGEAYLGTINTTAIQATIDYSCPGNAYGINDTLKGTITGNATGINVDMSASVGGNPTGINVAIYGTYPTSTAAGAAISFTGTTTNDAFGEIITNDANSVGGNAYGDSIYVDGVETGDALGVIARVNVSDNVAGASIGITGCVGTDIGGFPPVANYILRQPGSSIGVKSLVYSADANAIGMGIISASATNDNFGSHIYVGDAGGAATGVFVNLPGNVGGSVTGANIFADPSSIGTYGDITGINTEAYGVSGEGSGFVYGTVSNAFFANTCMGVYGGATHGETDDIGVYGSSDGYGSGTNYGIYGYVGANTCGFGPLSSCTAAAGAFDGDVWAANYYSPSDTMLKDSIQPLQNAMVIINQLKPKSYTFKTADFPTVRLPEGQQEGLIAQDVETILPGLVKSFNVLPPMDSLHHYDQNSIVRIKELNYIGFIPFLIAGLQQQQQTIDSLKTQQQVLDSSQAAQQQALDSLSSQSIQQGVVNQNMQNTIKTEQQLLDSINNQSLQQVVINQNMQNTINNQQQMIDSINNQSAQQGAINQNLQNTINTQQQLLDSLLNIMTQLQSTVNNCCASNSNQRRSSQSDTSTTNVNLSNTGGIILNQNDPNPFKENTTISFNIPSTVGQAKIIFYDNLGRIINTVVINERGPGQLDVFASNLSAGIYSYSLLADGQVIDTKNMVCAK